MLWGLRGFLRHPLSLDESRAILRRRLHRREVDFLTLVGQTVYRNPTSPYLWLLELAGCELGDLVRLVQQEGLEGALQMLSHKGVYLTLEELKGREPVVRGSARLTLAPAQLRNPDSTVAVISQSGGSRGPSQAIPVDLPTIRERAVNTCLTLAARGGLDWSKAHWGVPGASTVTILRFAGFGEMPVRWFWQVDPAAPGLHPRYRWSARLLQWGSWLAGRPLPRPRYVPLDDPLPLARWLVAERRAGRTPHLHTFVSPAVRLCEAAGAAGLDFAGVQMTVVGEPTTRARLAAIRRSGAIAVPDYGFAESGGFIAYGCLAPRESDDLHLCDDLHALIQPGPEAAAMGLPPRALLVSSIRPTAPLVLLNVSTGDQAELIERSCGCPLEELGWHTHLHDVRSFGKLTAGGMTFADSDLVKVLETVLPARFGGGPSDYQVVEQEADDGHPVVCLLVHPRVGELDPGAVAEVFLQSIGSGSGVRRVMALQWRGADLLRVERRPPVMTQGGKILHLYRTGHETDPTREERVGAGEQCVP